MEQEVNNTENTENVANNGQQPDTNANELQAKIDSAVKTRLAREKEQQKLMQQQWEDERKTLLEENELLKKQFQSKLDQELESIPTSFRSLVSKLPIAEQITWLEEQKKEQQSKPKPTPIPSFGHKENLDSKGQIEHAPIDRIV